MLILYGLLMHEGFGRLVQCMCSADDEVLPDNPTCISSPQFFHVWLTFGTNDTKFPPRTVYGVKRSSNVDIPATRQ